MTGDLAMQPDEGFLDDVLCFVVDSAQHLAHITQQRALVMGNDRHQITGIQWWCARTGYCLRSRCAGVFAHLGSFSVHYRYRRWFGANLQA